MLSIRYSKERVVILWLGFIFLGVLAGLRWDIGGLDFYGYQKAFAAVYPLGQSSPTGSTGNIYHYELGFLFLERLVKAIDPSFPLFLLITTLFGTAVYARILALYRRSTRFS